MSKTNENISTTRRSFDSTTYKTHTHTHTITHKRDTEIFQNPDGREKELHVCVEKTSPLKGPKLLMDCL
jgi:hypothetical protein